MLSKQGIIDKAMEIGFCDIGFAGVEPFISQQQILQERADLYDWTLQNGFDLQSDLDPVKIMPDAKSMIVLIDNYYQFAFPNSLVGKFGRCYMDDDRVTRDGLAIRIKAFRRYLRDHGIESKVPAYMPHRLSAARAGLGSFGKNCMFYSRNAVRQSSWVVPVAILVDYEFKPDPPTMEVNCPKWCRNACIAACPTGALLGPNKINPRRCISYLSYFSEEITPLELREPMGMWVYGCDRCQNVCPRNEAWLAQELPENIRVKAKAADFDLIQLLHMDKSYFEQYIQPHMFYMSSQDIWHWKMNVARVMGNSRDKMYVSELIKAYKENNDPRVLGMIAWALGQLGGEKASVALQNFAQDAHGSVKEEIESAMLSSRPNLPCTIQTL
jgi:epoxyqueuosine reductase